MAEQLYILHVEDDHDDVELLELAFKDNGFPLYAEVITEGNRVLPWLNSQDRMPDVIVMDLNLPKMHGREILVKLKSHDKYKSIPLVVLTTSSSREEMIYCKDHGADEFITKPATVAGFSAAVKLIVETAGRKRAGS